MVSAINYEPQGVPLKVSRPMNAQTTRFSPARSGSLFLHAYGAGILIITNTFAVMLSDVVWKGSDKVCFLQPSARGERLIPSMAMGICPRQTFCLLPCSHEAYSHNFLHALMNDGIANTNLICSIMPHYANLHTHGRNTVIWMIHKHEWSFKLRTLLSCENPLREV